MNATDPVDRTARRLRAGYNAEKTGSSTASQLPDKDQLQSRVEAFFKGADPATARLRAPLRAKVDWALRALYEGVSPPAGEDLGFGFEAVVIADGSRPVFFIADDRLVAGAGNGPFVDVLLAHQTAIEAAARSVGRVETDDKPAPPGMDKWYEGTAFLVADNLAMTNRHVIERMVNEAQSATGPFTLRARYWLNFGAQAGGGARRFKIERVVFVGEDIIGNSGDISRLDLALLRIGAAEVGGIERPPPLKLSLDPVSTQKRIAVVGYPAAPAVYTGVGAPPVDHELEEVLRRLFDSRFGFKRCASGEVDAAAGFDGDVKGWTIKHDASTLSGNSGSPLLLLDEGVSRVVALHFKGMPREANCAHVFPKLAADLSNAGVPL